MRVLLDTHIILAIIENKTDRFVLNIQNVLFDFQNDFYISTVSLWEIAIKARLGKLHLTVGLSILPELLRGFGIRIFPIDERHVLACVDPEPPTKDPFDRMLLAQAEVEGLRLLTVDRALVSHALAVPIK